MYIYDIIFFFFLLSCTLYCCFDRNTTKNVDNMCCSYESSNLGLLGLIILIVPCIIFSGICCCLFGNILYFYITICNKWKKYISLSFLSALAFKMCHVCCETASSSSSSSSTTAFARTNEVSPQTNISNQNKEEKKRHQIPFILNPQQQLPLAIVDRKFDYEVSQV